MELYSLDNPDKRLEIDPQQFQVLIQDALQLIMMFIEDSNNGNLTTVSDIDTVELSNFARQVGNQHHPEFKLNSRELYRVLCTGINSNTAGYMADIPGGGLLQSSVGDLLTSAFNRWPGLYKGAPGLIEIEKYIIRWMSNLMGLPDSSGGIMTSGGSMANFNAVYISRFIKLGDSFSRGTLYVSDQTHHSVSKAARMAGIHPQRIREIPSNSNCAISNTELVSTIKADISNNLQPFLIVGNAGTTRTGAIDDLSTLASIAKEYNCWLHIDAAWAGSFLLTERGKMLMKGIENADSVTIDPHKAFWLPWGIGTLLVSEVKNLYSAFSIDADYLPFSDAEDLMSNPSVISAELSRNARGLQLWLPLKMYGIQVFQNYLNEKLDLAQWIYENLKQMPNVYVHTTPPLLGIVAFRIEKDGLSKEQLNIATQKLVDIVNRDNKVYISGLMVKNEFLARLAPLHFKTHKPHIEYVIELISLAVKDIMRGLP